MDGKLEKDRTVFYRTKEIIIYKDGRANFANIVFDSEKTAKFHVDLLLRTHEIKNPDDKAVTQDE